MEYTLEKCIAQAYSDNRFCEIDLFDYTLKSLFDTYRQGYIQISHPVNEESHYIGFDTLQRFIKDPNESLEDLFERLTGEPIDDLQTGSVELDKGLVRIEDLTDVAYTLTPTRAGTHPSNDWPFSDQRDLLVETNNVSGQALYERFVVSINGYLHRTSFVDKGLVVHDGFHSLRHSNENLICAIDFKDIGKVDIQPIDIDSMVFRISSDSALYETLLIDTGVDLTEKTVFLSIGGYLHPLDNLYTVISESVIEVSMSSYELITRHMDSKAWIDLSDMPGERFDRNDSKRKVSDFYSDEYIRFLLSLSQSFLIIIDTPHVYTQYHYLQPAHLPGMFFNNYNPSRAFLYGDYVRKEYWEQNFQALPLIAQRGRVKSYYRKEDDGVEIIKTDDHRLNNYRFDYNELPEQDFVTDQLDSNRPYRDSDAHFLDIGVDRLYFE